MMNSTLAQTIPLTKRDIEKAYKPKWINLPEGSTTYLLLSVASLIGWIYSPLVAIGGLLVAWEGMSPANLDTDELTEQEAYLLALLADEHPTTKETLNTIMRNAIGRCSGDRSLASEVMEAVLQKAYFDTRVGCYRVDNGSQVVHVSTFAEQYFCQLFNAQSRFLHISPKQEAPALGVSPASVEPANESVTAAAETVLATTQITFNLDDLFDAPTALPANASELMALLELQYPNLLLLVKSAPIRLVGKQRTGKSTFARKLALLRSVLLPGHTVIWATPHREADNPVPNNLNPFGTTASGAKDFSAIERVWQATQAAIDNGQQLNSTAVWDEFGSYDAFENEEALGKSLKSMLREATKHSYFPILIAHGDQASFYPGVKNILGTLHSSTVKVETVGKVANAFGEMKPTGEVEITWLNGAQTQFKVPDWLTVDLLLSLQPTVARPVLLDAVVTDTPKPPVKAAEPVEVLSDVERLERLYKGSENELKPDLEKVFDYITSFMPNVGDKVKARDLYKDARSKTVGITAENAAAYMQDLATLESNQFKFDQQTLNTGSVSQFLVRIS